MSCLSLTYSTNRKGHKCGFVLKKLLATNKLVLCSATPKQCPITKWPFVGIRKAITSM